MGITPHWGSLSCRVGSYCSISGLSGFNISDSDRMVVREYGSQCKVCGCSGIADPGGRGGICNYDIQDTTVVSTNSSLKYWCYVQDGACSDQMKSVVYPNLLISFLACAQPSKAAPGFGGISAVTGGNGTTFTWDQPVTALGGVYDLCWCSGTLGYNCSDLVGFFLPVGSLAVAGPVIGAGATTYNCTAGLVCHVALQGKTFG